MKLDTVLSRSSGMDLFGKRAVVLGATAGLGRAVALRLARSGVGIIAVGRTEKGIVQELEAASAQGSKERGAAGQAGKPVHSFRACDLSMLADVRQLAKDVVEKDRIQALDFLVLSQGIATMQGRTETSEKIDVKMALHYYSRMQACESFMPVLERAQQPKVVSILSGGVHKPYTEWSKDVELKNNYSLSNAANAAGFYNDIGLAQMAKEHPTVTFIHSAPGFVATSWGTELNPLLRGVVRVLQAAFAKSAAEAADFLCDPLFDTNLSRGFHLRSPSAESAPVAPGADQATPAVWAHTKQVLARR